MIGLLSDPIVVLCLGEFIVLVAMIVGMCRYASQHYVGAAATGWRHTTWEKLRVAEAAAHLYRDQVEAEEASYLTVEWEEVT